MQKIKPTALLYKVRKSVSEILNKPFTERINHQIFQPDKRILAFWAADCAEHVLPFFQVKYPNDARPLRAIETCRRWAVNGVFKMVDIRMASLDAHAAAKIAKEDDARFAAHVAGQAVGTAHVPTHSLGASVYGIRAAAAHSGFTEERLVEEYNWQMKRLRHYAKTS